jgi:hypothetical protein
VKIMRILLLGYTSVAFVILPVSVLASSNNMEKSVQQPPNKLRHSIGIGTQYGLFGGYQVSLDNRDFRYRGAIGLGGLGGGFDYFVSDKFSVGATTIFSVGRQDSINLTYYPVSRVKGFNYGIDLVNDGVFGTGSGKNVFRAQFKVGYMF